MKLCGYKVNIFYSFHIVQQKSFINLLYTEYEGEINLIKFLNIFKLKRI